MHCKGWMVKFHCLEFCILFDKSAIARHRSCSNFLLFSTFYREHGQLFSWDLFLLMKWLDKMVYILLRFLMHITGFISRNDVVIISEYLFPFPFQRNMRYFISCMFLIFLSLRGGKWYLLYRHFFDHWGWIFYYMFINEFYFVHSTNIYESPSSISPMNFLLM